MLIAALRYLEEEVAGELLDGEHVGDDGVGAEFVERDGADNALRGQDGAADEQHVRLLLAQRVDAPEEANPVAGAVVGVVGSGGRQHGVALPLHAARDELPEVAEANDPHPQRRQRGRCCRWRRLVAPAVARDGLPVPVLVDRRGGGLRRSGDGRSDRTERHEGAEVGDVAAQEAGGAGARARARRRGHGGCACACGETAGAGEMAKRGGHRWIDRCAGSWLIVLSPLRTQKAETRGR